MISPTLSKQDRQELRDSVRGDIEAMLVEVGELASCEELERLASEMLVPFGLPGIPPELGVAMVEAVEASSSPAAPELLAAFAALGRDEVRSSAQAAAERLGRRSRFASELGKIEAHGAALLEAGDGEILQLRFERPGGSYQLGALFIERLETGGAAVDGQLTSPLPELPPFQDGPDGTPARELSLEQARRRAHQALERSAELELAVGQELGVCLPLTSLGLTGSPDGLPRMMVEEPAGEEDAAGPLYADPLDEDAFQLISRSLLGELEDRLDAGGIDSAQAQELRFGAESALQWKWGYAGGSLGRWSADDVGEYLLEYAPRKLPSDDVTVATVPEALGELLKMLDARGSLAGEPLAELLEAVDDLRADHAELARDPSSWGLAKSLVAQMEAEGLDPTDQDALSAWTEEFNARSFEERDSVLGAPLGRSGAGASPPPRGPSRGERRGKRKAARDARRRNRR